MSFLKEADLTPTGVGDRLQEKETRAWGVGALLFLSAAGASRGGSRGVGLEGVAMPLPALRTGEIPECAGVTCASLYLTRPLSTSLLSCVTLAVVSSGAKPGCTEVERASWCHTPAPGARTSGGSIPRLSYPHLPTIRRQAAVTRKIFFVDVVFSFEKGTLPEQRVGVRKRVASALPAPFCPCRELF